MMLFSETAWVLSETIITALYNGRGGAETVAAGRIANVFFMAFGAVITATSVLVGSTLGAGRLEEARQKGRWILYGSIAFGAIVGALAAASTFLIPLVFGRLSDDARRVATGLVIVIASYIPLWTLLNAQFALSRSGGDTAMGVWVDVGVTYVVFLPIAFGLAWGTSLGPVALFAIAKLSDLGQDRHRLLVAREGEVGEEPGGQGSDLSRRLKYSKHFNSLLCNCSKTSGFLRKLRISR